jgi:cytochrome c551/c552
MKKTILILLFLLVAIQFIQPDKTNPQTDDALKLQAPQDVINILKRACFDCHSNETKWPNYSYIAPISWSVVSHVNDGRKAINFSEYKKIDPKIKQKRLKRAIQTINNTMMPLSGYIQFHKEAVLSDNDKKILVKWLNEELKK